jgi:ABC-type multidrug transport system permease subunit
MINLTAVYDGNNVLSIYQAINEQSGGIITIVLLCVIYFVILAVFSHRGFKEVFLADGFFITLLSILALGMGLIQLHILIYPIILLFAGILVFMFVD